MSELNRRIGALAVVTLMLITGWYFFIHFPIANQLDPIERQKYEIALKQFRNKPIIPRTKLVMNNIILKVLPSTSAKTISKVYRKIAKKSAFSGLSSNWE